MAAMQPYSTPGGVPPKKKVSPLVWILAAAAGLVLIVMLVVVAGGLFVFHKARQAGLDPDLMRSNPALAVTKFVTAMNPDVEVLSVDDRKGVIRVREKSTGKVLIMNFEDAKQGKVKFQEDGKEAVSITASGDGSSGSVEVKSPEGVARFGQGGKLPDWVPNYPGSSPQGAFTMQGAEGENAAFHFKTSDAPSKVLGFYNDELKKAGWKVSMTASGDEGGVVVAEQPAQQRTLMVTVGAGEGAEVNLSVTTRKHH